MKLEAIGKPFIYRWPGGEVRLEAGKPIELPPGRAAKLLVRASGRVRQVESEEPITIEPADEAVRARPVYWERDGQILGPAMVMDFAKAGGKFWLWIEYQGHGRWIRDVLLRSKAQFEAARPRLGLL